MEAVDISIAKYALNLVVKTATTAITDEIGLLLGVQKELFFIKEDLEMMQAFLIAASIEDVKGQMVTTWINQVQTLAFDVEDCLQEASDHLMKKSCLSVMCSVKKRHRIVEKIQELKTRMEDVIKRNQRYSLINKRNGGPTLNESASTRFVPNVEALLVGLEEPKRRLIHLILKEHVEGGVISVVGVGGLGKTTLVRKVYGCQELRDVFKCFSWVTVLHPFTREEFIESLARQIPFDAQNIDIMRGAMEGNKIKPELLRKKRIQNLEEKVIEYLKDKKYLIVLDDLSSMSEWFNIKDVLPKVNGSRFIVTTRLRPLAESISHPSDNIYEMNFLSKNDAFDLFCKAVYKAPNYRLVIDHRETKDDPSDESKCNMTYGPSSTEIVEEDSEMQKQCITITITGNMEAEASLIIRSCSWLPLAILNIGSYLATRPKTNAEWKTMNDHLSLGLLNNPKLGVGKIVLSPSYDGMPDHLKSCLLYLSIFHNHKEIRRSRIIRRWMADGYVMQGRKRTAEEEGKGYFYDLIERCFIHPSQMSKIVNGDVKRCDIHDMIYQLILSKAVDLNIVSLLKDENLTMTDKVRHLVIASGPCAGDKVLERVKLSHMQSVSIFGEVGDYLRYHKMKLVRVLDLEGTSDLNNRDLTSVGKLRHLKYLGLRGTKITKLPFSLGKLSELETLDIRNTAVVRLPIGFTKLLKLSYLRAGFDLYNNPHIELTGIAYGSSQDPATILHNFLLGVLWFCFPTVLLGILLMIRKTKTMRGSFGVRAPRGIGELRSLSTLGMIYIGRSNGLAKEIQNLTNLRKLAVTGFTKENGKTLAKVIDGLKHLKSLVLEAADESGLRCCLHSVSSPPEYLQSLKLYSSLDELPNWISSLENLEKIHFRNTELTGEIKAIENLPNLKILYLLRDSLRGDVKELCFGEGTFPMLQVMILEEIYRLKSVSIEKTALKRLEHLKIRKRWGIREDGVSGLEFLVQLKEMEVDSDDDIQEQLNKSNRKFVRNIQEQLKKLPKEPILRLIKY